MSTVERRQSPVYRQLEAYEESWKRDHDALQECWACEDTIAVGLSTYSLVERVERAWRERVFRGTEDYCAEANEFHRALFEMWLRVTTEVLARTAGMQETYDSVQGADELRQAEERARERLTHWRSPKISSAVGLREMTLSHESAAELDRILQEAKQLPPEQPRSTMQELSAADLKLRARK